ncbi:MAG: XrtA-associated tyrosine autokinase [Alphaproteobacteria bacterium]
MDLIERAAANLAKVRRATDDRPQAADSEVRERRLAADAAVALQGHRLVETPEKRPEGLAEARKSRLAASIDVARLKSAGLVTPFGARNRIDEEFRVIKRPLLLKAFAKGHDAVHNGHLIMVTSAHPGEGKTFCSISLAMSVAAEPDLNVLLVDADVMRPSIPDVLGIQAERGLIDLIADESLDFSDVLIRTNIENLTVLPAGRAHHLAPELLASERMGSIVEDMAHRYPDRVIVFDSPPSLASSVPGVLALHVGQIAFIVEAERTSEAAVNAGLAAVGNCKNIGLVLNRTRSTRASGRLYSYYYGYGRESA